MPNMPSMFRRVQGFFAHSSQINNNNNNNNPNNNHNHNNTDNRNRYEMLKLQSTGYQRLSDGSVTISVKFDKDQLQCCVCLSPMTKKIFRCQNQKIFHNVCSDCVWQIRRIKQQNGHTKHVCCPVCKCNGDFIRNTILEEQLHELSKPCVHFKDGCTFKYFPWEEESKDRHKYECMFESVQCPFCNQSIPGGRVNFATHLTKSMRDDASLNSDEEVKEEFEDDTQQQSSDIVGCLMKFKKIEPDMAMNGIVRLEGNSNSFVINIDLGIILCFIYGNNHWKICGISIAPVHNICGNSRIYLSYVKAKEHTDFRAVENKMGLTCECIIRPVMNTINFTLSRLVPTNLKVIVDKLSNSPKENDTVNEESEGKMDDDSNNNGNVGDSMELISNMIDVDNIKPVKWVGLSPLTEIHYAYMINDNNAPLLVRTFTLEESFQIGSVIDVRDFNGNWYQSEIIKIMDSNMQEYDKIDTQNQLSVLDVRCVKVHYLGYSTNYDEWLNVDTDSHRIAQRGTFTMGPDLRAIRRNAAMNRNAAINRLRLNNTRSRVSSSSMSSIPPQISQECDN